MIEEIIKKDALVKIFPVGEEAGRSSYIETPVWGSGIIRKFVSETEINVQMEEEIPLEKAVCYAIYILSYEKVYLTYAYYRSSFLEEGKNMVSLEIVSPMERVQRRMHQRVSCHSSLYFRQIPKESFTGDFKGEQTEISTPEYEDSMVDISGGGIRFTTKREVREDEYLHVTFRVELAGRTVPISLFGQVVQAGKMRNEQEYYDVRMKYVGISEQEKEQIIHFVFQLERTT